VLIGNLLLKFQEDVTTSNTDEGDDKFLRNVRASLLNYMAH
jgi:hypothetical protein